MAYRKRLTKGVPMLRIANVSLPLDFSERDLLAIAAHKLRVPVSSIRSVSIARRSVDARDKRDVHFVASLDIDVLHEDALLKKSKGTSREAAEYAFTATTTWTA